jgi:hypothetical protein
MATRIDTSTIDALVIVLFIVAIFLVRKNVSANKTFRDAAAFETNDQRRREIVEKDRSMAPKLENATHEEKLETEDTLKEIMLLQNYLKREERFMPQIMNLVKGSRLKKEGEGIPGIQEIINFCNEENLLLDRIIEKLRKPEEISQRLVDAFRSEEKEIGNATHKADVKEREAYWEGALSREEIERVRKEDKLDRVLRDRLLAAETDEKKIMHEVRNAVKKCRTVKDLNNTIVKLANTKDREKSKEIRDVSMIQQDISKKEALIQDIITSLRVVSYDEDKVMQLLKTSERIEDKEKKT